MTNKKVYQMALSAILMAVAILIPIIAPKVIIPPASFTLASHVAIIIAMFISPVVAITVELGATLGFLLYGFPMVVVMRALSQVIFVVIGAIILKKKPEVMKNFVSMILFALFIGVIHAGAEVIVSIGFYGINNDFMYNIMVLVGVGTLVHSCVDFAIAVAVWKVIVKSPSIARVSVVTEVLA